MSTSPSPCGDAETAWPRPPPRRPAQRDAVLLLGNFQRVLCPGLLGRVQRVLQRPLAVAGRVEQVRQFEHRLRADLFQLLGRPQLQVAAFVRRSAGPGTLRAPCRARNSSALRRAGSTPDAGSGPAAGRPWRARPAGPPGWRPAPGRTPCPAPPRPSAGPRPPRATGRSGGPTGPPRAARNAGRSSPAGRPSSRRPSATNALASTIPRSTAVAMKGLPADSRSTSCKASSGRLPAIDSASCRRWSCAERRQPQVQDGRETSAADGSGGTSSLRKAATISTRQPFRWPRRLVCQCRRSLRDSSSAHWQSSSTTTVGPAPSPRLHRSSASASRLRASPKASGPTAREGSVPSTSASCGSAAPAASQLSPKCSRSPAASCGSRRAAAPMSAATPSSTANGRWPRWATAWPRSTHTSWCARPRVHSPSSRVLPPPDSASTYTSPPPSSPRGLQLLVQLPQLGAPADKRRLGQGRPRVVQADDQRRLGLAACERRPDRLQVRSGRRGLLVAFPRFLAQQPLDHFVQGPRHRQPQAPQFGRHHGHVLPQHLVHRRAAEGRLPGQALEQHDSQPSTDRNRPPPRRPADRPAPGPRTAPPRGTGRRPPPPAGVRGPSRNPPAPPAAPPPPGPR